MVAISIAPKGITIAKDLIDKFYSTIRQGFKSVMPLLGTMNAERKHIVSIGHKHCAYELQKARGRKGKGKPNNFTSDVLGSTMAQRFLLTFVP